MYPASNHALNYTLSDGGKKNVGCTLHQLQTESPQECARMAACGLLQYPVHIAHYILQCLTNYAGCDTLLGLCIALAT